MILTKKTYNYIDMLRIPFKASPGYAVLHFALKITTFLLLTIKTLVIAALVNAVLLADGVLVADLAIIVPIAFLIVSILIEIASPLVLRLIENKMTLLFKEKIRPEMINKYARLEYKNIENNNIHDLLYRVCPEIDTKLFKMYITLLDISRIIIAISSAIILLISQLWWVGLMYAVLIFPILFLSKRFSKRNYDIERKLSEKHRSTHYLSEILLSHEALLERRLFGFEKTMNEKFKKRYSENFEYVMNVIKINMLKMKSVNVAITLMGIAVIFLMAYNTINGTLSVGMFVGLTGHILAVNTILAWGFGEQFENLYVNREYLKDLSLFVSLSEYKNDDTGLYTKMDFKKIEFKNVSFKYSETEHYILNNLSFEIKRGKHYSIVGENGSGKTTIMKLLTGLYTCFEGEILIDGISIKEYPMEKLNRFVSIIHQDFAKYNITLRENILLGLLHQHDNHEEKIQKAIKEAELTEVIKKLPNGADTLLGSSFEDGVDISIGEWQKIALARNIVNDCPLKILDEPTSALDPISESFIYHKYGEVFKNTTTIMISHRLGSTKLSDEIFVLSRGTIVESGTHTTASKKRYLFRYVRSTSKMVPTIKGVGYVFAYN